MWTWKAIAALLLAALPLPQALAQAPVQEEQPAGRFGEEIDVRVTTLVVRVVSFGGEPVYGLGPADFRVLAGKQEIPVATVDWISSEVPALPEEEPEEELPPGVALLPPPAPEGKSAQPEMVADPFGKLVLFFVQADNNAPSRTRGHLSTLPYVRELLASLPAADRVGVVSFDSHLKLRQDFTADRAAVLEAVEQAIHFGHLPARHGAADGPGALAASFDPGAARRAASPERALEVTAKALAALPGEKVIVYLGWGLGRFGGGGTQMIPAYGPAVKALVQARSSVFVLDVTDALSHSLETGLMRVAEHTGGTYAKTNELPALAIRRLARTTSGHYLLTLGGEIPVDARELRVEVRGRRVLVLVRPPEVAY